MTPTSATVVHATLMTPAQRNEYETAASNDPQARVLSRTAALLITDGWCQRSSSDDNGRRCLVMAVATSVCDLFPDWQATVAHSLYVDVVSLLADAIEDRDGQQMVELWNDDAARSLDDVLDVIASARAVTG